MPSSEFARGSSVAVRVSISVILALVPTVKASSQLLERDFAGVAAAYSITPNLTYHRASGVDLKLDV